MYIQEQGAVLSFSENRFHVTYKSEELRSIPGETVEVIEIFGNVQITTQCMNACLKRGVCILFYSINGSYYGRLASTCHANPFRQRKQAALGEDELFAAAFSKRIIDAKINNQMVVLRRYARNRDVDISRDLVLMGEMRKKITSEQTQSINEIMGFEGMAARIYFNVLGNLIEPIFKFDKRTRRPPTDPFNSLISLGYSIIMNEIYGKIEAKGLNPYFGFMHKDHENHPTLASDLIEEWRAVLVDSLALSMLNGHELIPDDFSTDDETGAIILENEGFSKYITKIEAKLRFEMKYLDYVDYSVSFRRAMDLQINQLVKAIEEGDTSLYHPLIIR